MTDMSVLHAEAAKARAAASVSERGSARNALPCGEAQRVDVKFRTEFREPHLVERDGQQYYQLEGYASMTEVRYEMWDLFGPYNEVVSASAFDRTLAAEPMVVYRFNHGGTPMANTRNGRLELWVDALGFGNRAWVNPKRADVAELVTAIADRDVTEQSFMFMITDGSWNEEYDEFRIAQVDLDRGDVGPVTYGANPHTLVAARSGQFLDAIPDMPALVAREAMTRLAGRRDLIPSVVRALGDPDDVNMITQAMAWFTAIDSIADEAQEALAGYLQVPSPDPDDADDTTANAAPAKPSRNRPRPKAASDAADRAAGMSVELALVQLDLDRQRTA